MPAKRIIVIGGGISGLACAHRLRRAGLAVTLLEESERIGGVIQSVREAGFLFELGPQSFLSTELLLELIESLGLTAELLRADPRAPRFVLASGKLHKVPMAPPALLTTSLLSVSARLRVLSEMFRNSTPPQGDESVAAFLRRKFDDALLDNLVGPFVSGVYAGDPEKLSLRAAFSHVHEWESKYGSVLRGAMKSRPPKDKPRAALCSFREGVATLPRALGDSLGDSLQRHSRVTAIRRTSAVGAPAFELDTARGDRNERLNADAVVLATPANVSARLLAGDGQGFTDALARIEYAPVAVVSAGYRREQMDVPADGFGFLISRREKRRILGTVWNSSLFPGRAPEGIVLLTSFAGGATDPDLVSRSEDQIAELVRGEVAQIMRISGAPVAQHVQRSERAIPQFNLGHTELISSLRAACADAPGIFLTGNYLGGPSIGACVDHAFATADAVAQYCGALTDRVNSGAQASAAVKTPRST
jgi:oxygen-dependent protoporphyrinogen oxidase